MVMVVILHIIGYIGKVVWGSTLEAGLGIFIGNIALPVLIFRSIAKLNLSEANANILISALLGKLIVFLIASMVGYVAGKHSDCPKLALTGAGATALFATQSDDIGLGYPFFMSLFPIYEAHLLFLLAAVQQLVVAPIAFILMELGNAHPTPNF